jgi:hypothetical protein
VWFSGLIAPGLNPVIVEVAGRKDREVAVSQIRLSIDELGLFFGIVLIDGSAAPEWRVDRGKAVLVIGVQRFVGLAADELRSIVTDGRNKLMHGRR